MFMIYGSFAPPMSEHGPTCLSTKASACPHSATLPGHCTPPPSGSTHIAKFLPACLTKLLIRTQLTPHWSKSLSNRCSVCAVGIGDLWMRSKAPLSKYTFPFMNHDIGVLF